MTSYSKWLNNNYSVPYNFRELYSGLAEIITVDRKSVIAGNLKYRGNTTEVLIRIGWSL